MREIKFRCWDKDKEEMVGVRSVHYDTENRVVGCRCGKATPSDMPIRNPILMQYTGLKDKNGVEIYEGDVVQDIKKTNCEVYWRDEVAGFEFIWGSKDDPESWMPNIDTVAGTFKVIGNIYSNPELCPK